MTIGERLNLNLAMLRDTPDEKYIEVPIADMREAAAKLDKYEEALRPFAKFINQYERKPVQWDDEFISIHVGTEFETSLKLSDLRIARKALGGNNG